MTRQYSYALSCTFVLACLMATGCMSIPDESALLDMTAKGDRYVVTILDYDRANKIVSLYREFQGAKSVQRRDLPMELHTRDRNGRVVTEGSVDLTELQLGGNRQKAEFIRYDVEYYHYDGSRWMPIVSPERFLKNQGKAKREP